MNLSLVGIHTETLPQKGGEKGGDGGTGEMTWQLRAHTVLRGVESGTQHPHWVAQRHL